MGNEKLIRPDIVHMAPYVPIVPFDILSKRLGRASHEIIKLDANENPYGPSPRIYQALVDETYYHIYPDPESTKLRQALSDYTGVDASHIVAGHGADELIDIIIRLFITPRDVVINCPPTFGMYQFDTELNGGTLVEIPRNPDFSLDTASVREAIERTERVKLLFITSPNNPDGGVLPDACLRELLSLRIIVVLDEAYIEFAKIGSSTGSRVDWVSGRDNLIVLRTFSKWAGLAGLRVGYGVFPHWILEHLLKIKQPYNVNVAGTTAAVASLADTERLMANVKKLQTERERLAKGLNRFDFLETYPSQANFILCRVIGRSAAELKASLEKQGILIRYFRKQGLTEYVRISVGTPAHTSSLLNALAEKV